VLEQPVEQASSGAIQAFIDVFAVVKRLWGFVKARLRRTGVKQLLHEPRATHGTGASMSGDRMTTIGNLRPGHSSKFGC
jgi:hypothetical protein